ncbi:hypothetical protein GE09DRAFT_1151025 [Coniochaeta sp. 2T2.1]|nr:hypothetical protein GE09DRAFT_1151025 [Coniochaeta sp. 2T2.1]
MRAASVAGLVLASLTKLANAEDLLFYNDMLYNEYKEATTTLGYTAKIASDAEWRSYTTADFAKYKAIIVPDPNCGTIDKIKFLEDTKAIWSPAVTGNVILIGTDPTYHSSSRSGAIDLIDDSIRFAASDSKGTGLYFSLSCYYDSGDITTINALSEFGTFYVRGRLACYNDAHMVADAPELKSLTDDSIGNWSCSVHEVFTEFPKNGMEPGTDGFEAFAIARNATGDGEESYADGSSGIPYIIARGATPVGCGDGKIEKSFGEECDNGKDSNGAPGNPCSTSCKCLFGVRSPGVCKVSNTTSSSSSLSSSSTVLSNSSTALPSPSANSTLPSSAPPETTTLAAPSAPPASSPTTDFITVTASGATPLPPVVPSNSSDPAGPAPPVTLTASADSPDPSAPVSEPGTPPSGPLSPITIITTIDGPTPSVITVIATADPPLSADTGSGPPPPITIVTTIDGPIPSVITIIADPPMGTHPMVPPPVSSGAPGFSDPSYTTVSGPGASASGEPGSPGSTTVLTAAGPGASGPASSGPIIPLLPSGGVSGSGSRSFVTVVTSAPGNPGSGPATSAPGNGPSNPGSVPLAPGNPPLSTETSVRTVSSTAAPNGSGPSNPGGGTPSSAAASAPAAGSSAAPSAPDASTSIATSVVTTVNSAGAPSSAVPNGPGSSAASSGTPGAGSPSSGAPGSPTSSGAAAGGPSEPGTSTSTNTSRLSALQSDTSTSIDTSRLSALSSLSPSSGSADLPGASGSATSGSAAPTSGASGSLTAANPGAPTSGAGTGSAAPGSATSASGGSPADTTFSGLPTTSGSGVGASGPSASGSASSGSGASNTGSSNPTSSSGASLPSSSGVFSNGTAPTSLPSNPHPPVSSGDISASASPIASSLASGNPVLPSSSASLPINGTILTLSTNLPSGTALPSTLVTATLPAGPDSTCDAYIGIEIIEFIEITEVCPQGATVTETITTCMSTMTRPVCHTSTPGYPCYPCMGLKPAAGDTATVTRSSCTTSPLTTITTLTAQSCHTCEPVTYTTSSIPGYVPGGWCKDCQSYTPGDALTLPTTVTVQATATATVRVSQPAGCRDCPDVGETGLPDPGTPGAGAGTGSPGGSSPGAGAGSGGGSGDGSDPATPPGNPGLPNTTPAYVGNGPATTASTPATVPKPSTVPSYVTAAGGPRGVAFELGAAVVAAGVWAFMMI